MGPGTATPRAAARGSTQGRRGRAVGYMGMRRTPGRERGIETIETLVVFSLLGLTLMGVVGLHTVAVSTGTAAETSSIATNLARARLEELLALSPAQILEQNNTEVIQHVPPGQGRAYSLRTAVDASNRARLDITVTVTWDVPFGA